MNFFHRVLVAAFVLVATANASLAHRLNESYLFFNVSDEALLGRIEATLNDLGQLVALDANADGVVSTDEAAVQGPAIFELFTSALKINHDGRNIDLVYSGIDFLDTPQGTFAQIKFMLPELSPTPQSVDLTYDSPFEAILPGHLGFAVIESNTRTGLVGNESYVSIIFEPGLTKHTLSLIGEPGWKVFKDFVVHGVLHIWFGFDHVVFLIGLLLPSVLFLGAAKWFPAPSFRPAFINVVKVATIFTVSHSITLSLAALDIVSLNSTFVEIVIAVSIVAVALMNLFPKLHKNSLWVVFGFGLFHGFGFANVLAPLGLVPSAKIIGLAAFNVGVEIGQIAIVLVVFPVLYVLRRWAAYQFLALKLGSVALILLAGVWIIERSTGIVYQLQQSVF